MLMLLLMGCGLEDDAPPELPFLEAEDDLMMEMHQVEYLFSDSARVVAKLTAGYMAERRTEDAQVRTRTELSRGVRVELYDGYGRVTGVIESDSARFLKRQKEAILYDDVRLTNENNEQLRCDSLVWSQAKDSIFTGSPVHIRTRAQEIHARDGLRGTADFSSYRLYGTSGEVVIDEN